MRLLDLDSELILSFWPPNRIVAGLLVSKKIHRALISSRHVVLRMRRGVDIPPFPGSFTQFKGTCDIVATRCAFCSPVSALSDAGRDGWNLVKSLDLEGNYIGMRGVKDLSCLLSSCVFLETLNLNENAIGSAGAKILAEIMPNLSRLVELRMQSNYIHDEGLIVLTSALDRCNNLTLLDLADNDLGPVGMEFLSSKLAENSSLTHLDLSNNAIGDEGATRLAANLFVSTKLSIKALSLRGNGITSEGAARLAAALPPLGQLDLGKNSIGAEGAGLIASSIRMWPAISSLDVRELMSTLLAARH